MGNSYVAPEVAIAQSVLSLFPRIYDPEPSRVLNRPGSKLIAHLPSKIMRLEWKEPKRPNRGLIAATLRGSFWIREGKKPRRIAA